jgi:hypothetical protein
LPIDMPKATFAKVALIKYRLCHFDRGVRTYAQRPIGGRECPPITGWIFSVGAGLAPARAACEPPLVSYLLDFIIFKRIGMKLFLPLGFKACFVD